MSTKLYYGLRYVGKRGMTGLMQELTDMRKKYKEHVIQQLLKVVDGALLQDDMELYNMLYHATHVDMRRGNPLDISCSATVHFARHKGEDYILVYPFGMAQGLLAKKRNFVPFGYWNNTDGPEEMTDAQWRERELIWDKATKHGHAMNQTSLVFEADAESTMRSICWDAIREYIKIHGRVRPPKLSKGVDEVTFTRSNFDCLNDLCVHRTECALSRRARYCGMNDKDKFLPYLTGKQTPKGTEPKRHGIVVTCRSYKKEEVKKGKKK